MSIGASRLSRMRKYIRQSKAEVAKYRKTRKLIYLEQASEKVYNAFILLLEAKFDVNIRSHADVAHYTRISREQDVIRLGSVANSLHKYFYESGSEFFIQRNLAQAWGMFRKIEKRI